MMGFEKTTRPGALAEPTADLLARHLGDALPLQTYTGGDPAVVAVLVGTFFVGLVGVYLGYSRYQKGQLIEETETVPIDSVTPGRVGITGTVRAVGETLNPPFTEGECVYYNFRVTDTVENEEKDEDGNTISTVETERVGRGSKSVEYYVEDDTGTALVAGDDGVEYSISSANSDTFRKKWRQPIEDPSFVHEDERLPSQVEQRQYRQSVLPVGEEVFVIGGARAAPTDENTATVIVGSDEETDTFIVSDEGKDDLASGFSRTGPLIVLVSLAVSVLMLYLLVSDFVLV